MNLILRLFIDAEIVLKKLFFDAIKSNVV